MTRSPFPTMPLPDDRIDELMQGREPWLIDYVKRIHEKRRDWLDEYAGQMREAA